MTRMSARNGRFALLWSAAAVRVSVAATLIGIISIIVISITGQIPGSAMM